MWHFLQLLLGVNKYEVLTPLVSFALFALFSLGGDSGLLQLQTNDKMKFKGERYFGLRGGWLTFWLTVACATDMTLVSGRENTIDNPCAMLMTRCSSAMIKVFSVA